MPLKKPLLLLLVCACVQNESDVLKWVVRKEFGELRRCLELEEAGFIEKVENAASTLISSIQRQSEHMSQLLAKIQSAEATLDALSNDSHLEFIVVSQTLSRSLFLRVFKN